MKIHGLINEVHLLLKIHIRKSPLSVKRPTVRGLSWLVLLYLCYITYDCMKLENTCLSSIDIKHWPRYILSKLKPPDPCFIGTAFETVTLAKEKYIHHFYRSNQFNFKPRRSNRILSYFNKHCTEYAEK